VGDRRISTASAADAAAAAAADKTKHKRVIVWLSTPANNPR